MNLTPKTLFGSIILEASTRNPEPLPLPELNALPFIEGVYVEGRQHGRWCEASDYVSTEVLMPTRHKNLLIRSSDEAAVPLLAGRLVTLDSEFINKRQIYKLGKLLDELPPTAPSFASTVNITSSENRTSSNSGFYLLSRDVPLYVYVVYDLRDHAIRLTWASFDIKPTIQATNLTRYAFYKMPDVLDMPLFVPTQMVCSRWYDFGKSIGKQKESALLLCNALEVMLYKNHKE